MNIRYIEGKKFLLHCTVACELCSFVFSDWGTMGNA